MRLNTLCKIKLIVKVELSWGYLSYTSRQIYTTLIQDFKTITSTGFYLQNSKEYLPIVTVSYSEWK